MIDLKFFIEYDWALPIYILSFMLNLGLLIMLGLKYRSFQKETFEMLDKFKSQLESLLEEQKKNIKNDKEILKMLNHSKATERKTIQKNQGPKKGKAVSIYPKKGHQSSVWHKEESK